MNSLAVTCPHAADTMKVGEKLGRQLKGGELIELIGDVGSGKTTFVKGLAKGLDTEDEVSSPSFALKNIYDGRLRLHHFDLYRLEKPGLFDHELKEALEDKAAVSVIEWAGISSDKLPLARITIEFIVTGKDSRKLIIDYPS